MKAFLITITVLLLVLLAADRFGVEYAENEVAAQLQEDLGLRTAPGVEIDGFPVLNQAVLGRYDDVRLSVVSADIGELSGLDVRVRLQGVKIPFSELVSGNIENIPVERVAGTVSIPYAEVAAQIGSGVTVEDGPDGVVVRQTLEVLGQELEVSGTGRIRVESSDQIGVTVVGLSLAGVDVPELFITQLQEQLSFTYTVPPLPFGLQITAATATADGFDVSAQAENTVLEPL